MKSHDSANSTVDLEWVRGQSGAGIKPTRNEEGDKFGKSPAGRRVLPKPHSVFSPNSYAAQSGMSSLKMGGSK